MYFTKSLFATCVCLAHVGISNAVQFTQWPSTLYPGEPATVNWEGALAVDSTIDLRKGSAANLDHIDTLTTDARGGTFTWTPPDDLEDGDDYAFRITQGGDINYSGLISVQHPTGPPSSKGPPPPPSPEPSVAKGNNGHVNMSSAHMDNSTSGKSAIPAEMKTGTASFQALSLNLVFGVAVIIFCFTR
ncbi:hypothetical protein BDW42DRAFT_73973 [Aspergillus taichungensis]|uniref:Yeast cell wall synthesis Kre9/Knh1-like N-terminal domain-containing protein n=1 Tax=Aspergillus taichungensis TaxID=482145 RepID=A0A2J5HZ43_9EURO|nr:hypothetical protein BDW42DRAFT_73973 [Aspergillus taichungensis]